MKFNTGRGIAIKNREYTLIRRLSSKNEALRYLCHKILGEQKSCKARRTEQTRQGRIYIRQADVCRGATKHCGIYAIKFSESKNLARQGVPSKRGKGVYIYTSSRRLSRSNEALRDLCLQEKKKATLMRDSVYMKSILKYSLKTE